MVITINLDLDLNLHEDEMKTFETFDVKTQYKMFLDAIDEMNKNNKSQISISYNDELLEKLELMKEMNEIE